MIRINFISNLICFPRDSFENLFFCLFLWSFWLDDILIKQQWVFIAFWIVQSWNHNFRLAHFGRFYRGIVVAVRVGRQWNLLISFGPFFDTVEILLVLTINLFLYGVFASVFVQNIIWILRLALLGDSRHLLLILRLVESGVFK